MADRLFIIDGHALIFKMYYAFLRRPMINSKGMDTSILFGFTKYLLELIEREHPTHLAVAFDPPGGSFRNELYPEYKANRAETPQLVIDALEPLTELCTCMNIPVLMIRGYEADDVIGSMAKKAALEGYDVYMVTPDKDYGQLIDTNIWQYKPGRGGDDEVVGVAEICAKYGIIDPIQVIDMLTICGDTADNVPGVKGIGEVWAGKLIAQYGSVENIYAHIGELSRKQADMFRAAEPHIALSKKLVTIKTDIETDVPTADTAINMDFNPQLADLFAKYEFNSLRKHIAHIGQGPAKTQEPLFGSIEVLKVDAVQLSKAVCVSGKCAFVVETVGSGIFAPVSRITMATMSKGGYVASEGGTAEFKALLEDPTITKFAYDIKLQMNVLAAAGVSLSGKLRDVELMHYLLDPEKSHSLDTLARHYLGAAITPDTPAQEKTGSLFDEDASQDGRPSTGRCNEAAAIIGIGAGVWADLQQASLTQLYETIEEPLISVLSRMERTGVKVETGPLLEFAASLRSEIAEKETFVRELAGNPSLNLSSPKQIGELIYETLKLDPKARKGARNWSTDEATLLEIQDRSPVIPAILEYRAAKKLLSTYIEPFPGYISPKTGRVHTTFNQALTSTGRLSSSNPNLQNIPIRTERGRLIRKAFVPGEEGWSILSADYSQIELRIMAHLSGDEHLVQAFRDGVDVHSATASKIFRVPLDQVTADQRRVAKTANFGIMYGISAFGLAQRLSVPRAEAKAIIDGYFESFPSIRGFIDRTVGAARTQGYVETLFGRRRYIKDISAGNASLRALAERNAVNAPIQGTSADIIKIAMIRIDKAMREASLRSRMVLQIHDELLFEVPEDELKTMKKMVTELMEGVISLSVPLTVECNYGKDWLDAH